MTIDKSFLLQAVIEQLRSQLQMLIDTALDAKAAATNEESKAENKYDTRGLEASYLAGAQAKRADDLKATLQNLKTVTLQNYGEQTAIGPTALVEIDIEGALKWFFILPVAGGLKIQYEGLTINTISMEAPLTAALLQKKVGESSSFMIHGTHREFEICRVF